MIKLYTCLFPPIVLGDRGIISVTVVPSRYLLSIVIGFDHFRNKEGDACLRCKVRSRY